MRKLGGVFLVTLLTMFGLFVTLAGPATAVTKSKVDANALSLQNMPMGWSVDNSSGSASGIGGCLKGPQSLHKPAKGIVRAFVQYEDGNVSDLQETVEAGKGSAERYRKFNAILMKCKAVSFTSGGIKFSGTVGAMSFPKVGDSSSAYAMSFTAKGVTVGLDLVLFKVGQFDGDLFYEDLSPDPSIVHAFATEAVNKIRGKATSPPSES